MPAKNPKEYQRQWLAKRRFEFFKDKACKCGATKNLELDHVDRTTKISHNIWSWSRERREIELAKCQVLCEKCHTKKTVLELSKPLVHGTNTCYNKGCRCRACKDAVVARFRGYRAKSST